MQAAAIARVAQPVTRHAMINVEVDIERYIQAASESVGKDNDLPICHMLDETEIAQTVTESRTANGESLQEDSDEEEEERVSVARKEVLNAPSTLSRAVEENHVGENNFQDLNQV